MATNGTAKLKSFMSGLAAHEKEEFAKKCETSVGYLNQIMYGNSKCSASLAIRIDKESRALVPCDDLCPEADFDYIRTQALIA